MPNWCNNNITVSHPDRSKMEALATAIKEGNFFKHIIPIPEDLNIVAGRVGDDTNPDQVELERRSAENLKKYGAANWYDFCTSRWGTKWDTDPYDPADVVVNEHNAITFGFDTAWGPAIGVYEAMVEDGYSVEATYYEPGMAFCGVWQDGCDDFYDISGMRSNEVRDALPEHLDEMYGISECMAEYEAEEMDEVQEWYEDGVDKHGLEPHKTNG